MSRIADRQMGTGSYKACSTNLDFQRTKAKGQLKDESIERKERRSHAIAKDTHTTTLARCCVAQHFTSLAEYVARELKKNNFSGKPVLFPRCCNHNGCQQSRSDVASVLPAEISTRAMLPIYAAAYFDYLVCVAGL